MDLYIDKDSLENGSHALITQKEEMENLKTDIEASFEQLRKDWDSQAGKLFFAKFEDDLIQNLDRYITVFDYMNKNLSTASQKYDEVFRAADTVASSQY
jgi:WXG100 family type VII secretion target